MKTYELSTDICLPFRVCPKGTCIIQCCVGTLNQTNFVAAWSEMLKRKTDIGMGVF